MWLVHAFRVCVWGGVRGFAVGKMAIVSSSAANFRNMAYNMFFKRTSTTLMFVMGKCENLFPKT